MAAIFSLPISPGRAPIKTTAPNPGTEPKQAAAPHTTSNPSYSKAEAFHHVAKLAIPALPRQHRQGADSLGSGNINIALASYFPPPKA